MLVYEVIGNPVPWQAPKWNKGRMYNPKNKEQQQTIWQLKPQFNHETLSCPVRMDITFYMPIPKSASKIKRRQMLNGMIAHITKPDRTNLLKFIEDCLQLAGILSNDSIVVAGEPFKTYGLVPKTLIRITPFRDIRETYPYASGELP